MMNPAADAWLDIKQLVVDTDAGAAATTRKRQRPPEGFADLKLEFTGLQVNNSPSGELTPLAGEMAAMDVNGPQELLELVHALRLGVASDPAALRSTLDRLALDGFDSLNAVAFARDDDLMRAGLAAPDAQQLGLAARARFAARKFQGPGSLAASVTVSRWLQLCGVPRASSLEYAELLCRLGYPHVPELELIVHDARALTVFKLGHGRLFLHCVAAAVHRLQLEQQAARHQLQGPTSDPASLMLTPLEFSRDGEQLDDEAQEVYDGFLDALMDPAPVAGMGSVDPFNVQQQQQLRVPPPELVQLLYEAVNLPRPNPCRRGKKIYWSVLATNGMKDARFARLAAYSAAELQNAYLRQFELPAAPAVKMDAWSDDNIRQLERAVKDPRCRHLSKVCWEMLATGRTGVDEYAPLAKFTASQLRSRFRSLFGDKRPQKLRQKKQMLKAQQQEAAAAAAAAATAKQEQNVLL